MFENHLKIVKNLRWKIINNHVAPINATIAKKDKEIENLKSEIQSLKSQIQAKEITTRKQSKDHSFVE